MGFNCLKAAKALQGDCLLFTTKSSKVLGTHLIARGIMKSYVDIGATPWDITRDPWIGNPGPNHKAICLKQEFSSTEV